MPEKNTCIYDIPRVVKDRGWLNPFEISPVPSEEISFEYQLLKYAVEARNGDFTSLYGACYIRAKATFNDSVQDFIGHIIDPFVDYVADFLKKQYDQAVKAETANKPLAPGVVTASNSTLLFNSSVTGNVANQYFKQIAVLSGGSTRTRISRKEIEKLKISLPGDIKEQIAISTILSTADREIDLLEQELTQWQAKNKSLMQLLLTGLVRVKI